MAFPQSVIDQVWRRSGGKCECTQSFCGHQGRCSKILTEHNWHVHNKTSVASGGDATLSNCKAICMECNQKYEDILYKAKELLKKIEEENRKAKDQND